MLNDVHSVVVPQAPATNRSSAPRAFPPRPSVIATARELYETLIEGDIDEAARARARAFLLAQLDLGNREPCDLPDRAADIPSWIAEGVARTGAEYRAYVAARKGGAPRRFFSNRSHALAFIKGVAATKLVDGAWLYGLLDHGKDSRYADLINIYLEELGDGEPGKNHVVLYRELLADNDIDNWQEVSDAHYVQGAIQLALSCLADEFLPEIIGFNLGYEQLPLHLPITAFELNELGIDPYYFTLHVTVDNADTGHARQAWSALRAAMPLRAGRDAFYSRVRAGYRLNALGACTESVIADFDLDREIVELFTRKAVVGKHMHADYCRVGGRSVSDWLTQPGQIPAFLMALESSGWIKRHHNPEESRFWKLLQGERAEMFGVFSKAEQQLIHDWILGSAGESSTSTGEGAERMPRAMSYRAKQRLVHQREDAAQVGRGSGFDEVMARDAAYPGHDDPDLQLLRQQIGEAGASVGALMRVLASWMSPALHHTPPGLMATRLYASHFGKGRP